MIDMDAAERAVDWLRDNASTLGAAKAHMIYLHEFRKSKKAILSQQSQANTVADREAEAYAHPEYQQLLEGLRVATEEYERLRWLATAAQAKIEIWRTECANARAEGRAYG